jgi:hypothetical protein
VLFIVGALNVGNCILFMYEHIKEVILILLCTGDSINLLLYIAICGCFLFVCYPVILLIVWVGSIRI